MAVVMLSLVSNPFDPFTDFAAWSAFDRKEGFDTAGLVARAVSTSDEISEPDQEEAVEMAVDSILNNPSFAGLYKKVVRGAA
jgi:hypothetical protein